MPKSKREKNRVAVLCTNDSSSKSKGSMCSLGYFKDDYIGHLVQDARRSPLINRGYYVRAKAVHKSLESFLGAFQGQPKQIISLGTGFDSAYFRLRGAGLLEQTNFFEVDFPEVVSRKSALIQSTEVFSSLLGEPVYHPVSSTTDQHCSGVTISSRSYQLLGLNLDNLNLLNDYLLQCGCDFEQPTLLLSECVMTYMEVRRSDALIEYCASTFHDAVFICYEQIYPNDPFGRVMMNHFQKLRSPLKAIGTYSSLEDYQERFLKLGWNSTSVVDMNHFYSSLELAERERIDRIEPFDEFEEWHLKCNHYILVTACKGSCISAFQDQIEPMSYNISDTSHQHGVLQANCHLTVKRTNGQKLDANPADAMTLFGHSCAKVHNDIIISGGFGRFGRQNGVFMVDHASGKIEGPLCNIEERMYHSMTRINDSLLVFGGRASPSKPCSKTLLVKFNDTEDTKECCCTVEDIALDGTYQLEARWRHSATPITYESKDAVLIFGGKNLTTVFDDVAILDVKCNKWHQLHTTGPQPGARHSHTASLWGDDGIVVACGLGHSEQPLNSIYLLQVQLWIWRTMETIPAIKPRYSHSAHILDDNLLLVGGVHIHGEVLPSITRISLTTGCWKEYTIQSPGPERILMLHNHDSILEDGDTLIIIGGGGNCFSFGTHFNDLLTYVKLDW